MKQGNLFIISAPSGTGKTTILKRVMDKIGRLAFSISHTTRMPRPSEQNGIDYHFIEQHKFIAMRNTGEFLEWASVHNNLYGTSRTAINTLLTQGIDIILDIDVQGGRQIKQNQELNAIFIFIVPPSWQVLEKRLISRNTNSAESIKLRIANSRQEMTNGSNYDYIVVNDKLEEAVDIVRSIIIAERHRNHEDNKLDQYVTIQQIPETTRNSRP